MLPSPLRRTLSISLLAAVALALPGTTAAAEPMGRPTRLADASWQAVLAPLTSFLDAFAPFGLWGTRGAATLTLRPARADGYEKAGVEIDPFGVKTVPPTPPPAPTETGESASQ